MNTYVKIIQFLLILFISPLCATSQVTVKPTLPKNIPALSATDAWTSIITNLSGIEQHIRVRLSIKSEEGDLIYEATTAAIHISTGVHHLLPPTFTVDHSQFYIQEYKNYADQYNYFPPAEYIICLSIDYVEGPRDVYEDCTTVGMLLSPPQLLSPKDGINNTGAMPLFTWFPPQPYHPASSFIYSFTMVEKLPNQSATEAILNNAPVYSRNDIPVSFLQYPIDAPVLNEEKEYAWQVSATSAGIVIGHSETWAFYFKQDSVKPENGISFVVVDRFSDNSIYNAYGRLGVIISNYHENHADVKILNDKGEHLKSKKIRVQRFEEDPSKFIIDVKGKGILKNGNFYTGVFYFPGSGAEYRIRFKYINP